MSLAVTNYSMNNWSNQLRCGFRVGIATGDGTVLKRPSRC